MTPMTRQEIFLSNAAGNGDDLPEAITREEQFFRDICNRINNVGNPTDEQVQTAVNNYLLDANLAEIATMQEFKGYIEGE